MTKLDKDEVTFKVHHLWVINLLRRTGNRALALDEITQGIDLAAAETRTTVNELLQWGLLTSGKSQRGSVYRLNPTNPLVRRLEVFFASVYLDPVVESLRAMSDKVILYGPGIESDEERGKVFDLCIVSKHQDQVLKAVKTEAKGVKVRPRVVTPAGYSQLIERDESLRRGVVLWEA